MFCHLLHGHLSSCRAFSFHFLGNQLSETLCSEAWQWSSLVDWRERIATSVVVYFVILCLNINEYLFWICHFTVMGRFTLHLITMCTKNILWEERPRWALCMLLCAIVSCGWIRNHWNGPFVLIWIFRAWETFLIESIWRHLAVIVVVISWTGARVSSSRLFHINDYTRILRKLLKRSSNRISSPGAGSVTFCYPLHKLWRDFTFHLVLFNIETSEARILDL